MEESTKYKGAMIPSTGSPVHITHKHEVFIDGLLMHVPRYKKDGKYHNVSTSEIMELMKESTCDGCALKDVRFKDFGDGEKRMVEYSIYAWSINDFTMFIKRLNDLIDFTKYKLES